MKFREVKHELSEEEKLDFIQETTIDELFDLINQNIGNHHKGFLKKELIERVLSDFPEYLICANKVSKIIDEMPLVNECKTSVEAFAVQELNKLF